MSIEMWAARLSTICFIVATSMLLVGTGCRVPVVDRGHNIVDGVPVLGSSVCCPPEQHPAGGCELGSCNRERYGPQRFPVDNPFALVTAWHDGPDCDGRWLVVERLVGKRRLNHCLPGSRRQIPVQYSDLYSEPRNGIYDSAVLENAILYLTLSRKTTLDGLKIRGYDILAFDGNGFALLVDGEDVGLENLKIDAFAVLDRNHVLISFDDDFEVDAEHPLPGLSGRVDNSDLVLLTMSSIGEITRGTFEPFFDGSDVGLNGDDENIDGLEVLGGGELVISTTGKTKVPGLDGDSRDLLMFTPKSLGNVTEGTWTRYLQVAALKLDENFSNQINAIAIDDANHVYLSFDDEFATGNAQGTATDIAIFMPRGLGNRTDGELYLNARLGGVRAGSKENNIAAIDLPSIACGVDPSVWLDAEDEENADDPTERNNAEQNDAEQSNENASTEEVKSEDGSGESFVPWNQRD